MFVEFLAACLITATLKVIEDTMMYMTHGYNAFAVRANLLF